MATYTIGQVAERTGFPASTLRYYEDEGLLQPVGRTEAGYRVYDDTSLGRLAFIDRAKQLGCTLEEISDLAGLWEAEDCGPVQARLHELVTAKIDEAERRSTALAAFVSQLQRAAAHLGGAAVDGPCGDHCACLHAPTETAPAGGEPVGLHPTAQTAIACTLPVGERPARVDDWQQILVHATSRTSTGEGRLRVGFDSAVRVEDVARLAAAEHGCCGFFDFAITVDERGVGLEVHAPAQAHEMVLGLFGTPV